MSESKFIVSDVNYEHTWPSDMNDETKFLSQKKLWKYPESDSGVHSKNAQKADFGMYYDRQDMTSPVNVLGNYILTLLPDFERHKISGPESKQGVRGNIILVYSPTTSAPFGTMPGMSP
eukprot:UN10814